ncbi:MAG: SurA N-terminal domain-containing protein, partial [Candidatus Parcubacteria bacterium]|nr:SurA N-terminal domain-containing protein [Candidatus Parcubacteria bacterium]
IVLGILAYFFRGLVIAATVNGSPISRLSVIQKLEKASGKTLLDSLITEKLVQNAAAANNISISDDEINAELKKVEDQVAASGSSLAEALTAQGMTMDELKTRIIVQKEMEKLLSDKIIVTDQEVAQYIKDNNITVAKGEEAATNGQIKSELSSQKFNSEAASYIADLKAKANIEYFVKY